MKKVTHRITHAESIRRPRLQLSREAIRTLRAGDLAAVNGGSGCVTTSWTSDKQRQGATAAGC